MSLSPAYQALIKLLARRIVRDQIDQRLAAAKAGQALEPGGEPEAASPTPNPDGKKRRKARKTV